MTEKSAFDTQVGGSHYKDYAIQPFEFLVRNNIPTHKGGIIQRILRYDHPTGKGLEDLEKIKHEIDMIIEIQGLKRGATSQGGGSNTVEEVVDALQHDNSLNFVLKR